MKDCENVILIWGTKLWVHRQFNLDNENMTVRISNKEREAKDYNSKVHICPIETF